jgi:hypothetical protein
MVTRVINRVTKRNGKGRGRGNGRRRQNGQRTRADKILAQGVLALPSRPFGAGRMSVDLRVWDAKLPHHLPLPRAVGPYTTIRVTERLTINEEVSVLGTFKFAEIHPSFAGEWSSIFCVRNAPGTAAGPIYSLGVTTASYSSASTLQNIGAAATLVPSAFSVQIMCPEPISSANGVIYAGNLSTSLAIAGDSRDWNVLASNFISNMNPRLLSAGKLALRGVQINSYPLNMAACSEFTPLVYTADFTGTYESEFAQPTGWSPIMIYNPDAAKLELLVTTEWRVRFDPFNPASASHQYHPVASDQTWGKLMHQAASLGNGVKDVVEAVANAGQMAKRAMNVFRSPAIADLPMLVD